MKKLFSLLLLTAVAVAVVFMVVPGQMEKTINEKAPKLLEIYGYKMVKSNGFNKWFDHIEYVVEREGKTDTVNVRLYRGQLSIQPK